MTKADKYFLETLLEIRDEGSFDKNPRPKYIDGTPAHSKFVTQKSFEYRIDKGEFPLISFRPTATKGGWHDIEAIYQKQTNVLEEMDSSIWPWWKDFIVGDVDGVGNHIGQTYGHTVSRYRQVDRLLHDLKNNPFSRRHMINMWQEQQMMEDPKALPPCAFMTQWSVSDIGDKRYIDVTLNQRSMDFLMTASINPMQYVQFAQAVVGHLNYHTNIRHVLRKFKHDIQNVHIYDRHLWAIDELLLRDPSSEKVNVTLKENKDFYSYTYGDFCITRPFILPLSKKLELAI